MDGLELGIAPHKVLADCLDLTQTIKVTRGLLLTQLKWLAGVLVDDDGLTTLTFPSAQGFDCFEVGDVVQGADVTASDTYDMYVSTGTNTNLSDMGSSVESINFGTRPTTAGTYKNVIYDVKKPLANVNFVRFLGAVSSANTFTYSGSNTGENDWVQIATGSDYPGPGDTSVSNGSTPYRYLRIITDPGDLTVSDYGIDDTILQQQVKVISKDDSDPYTITVDGGDWVSTQPTTIQYFDSYGDVDTDGTITRLEDAYNSEAIIKSLPQSYVNNKLGGYFGTVSYDGTTYPVQSITGGNTWSFNFLKGQLTKSLTNVAFNGAASLYAYTTDFITWTELTPSSVSSGIAYIDIPNNAVCTASWRGAGQGVGFDVPLDQRDDAVVITDGNTKLTKETPYDTKLTLAGGWSCRLVMW